MTTPAPPAGLIGLVPIAGDVGKLIEFGQWLNGDGFRKFEHAFVTLPGGLIIEAEPGGAVIVPLHYTGVYWCNGLYKLLPPNTTDTEIAHIGETLRGVPYSALDYFALVQHRLHLPEFGLQHFIGDSGHMICSQLADEFYLRLRAHIFLDGRWPGYVDPMALYNRDVELSGKLR
jgi:hypothetical protein